MADFCSPVLPRKPLIGPRPRPSQPSPASRRQVANGLRSGSKATRKQRRRFYLGCEPRSRLSVPQELLLTRPSIKPLGHEQEKGGKGSACLAQAQHKHRQLQPLASVTSAQPSTCTMLFSLKVRM